jgi:hypothetical protein
MSESLRQALEVVIDREAPNLRALADSTIQARTGWSPKEELGHLIDSAANNHQRFVRAALDGSMEGPGYEQNAWVELHGYANLPWTMLIDFWERYNRLLAVVIGRIPADRLGAPCIIGGKAPVTLGFVIEDYILHLQHHLDHIMQ